MQREMFLNDVLRVGVSLVLVALSAGLLVGPFPALVRRRVARAASERPRRTALKWAAWLAFLGLVLLTLALTAAFHPAALADGWSNQVVVESSPNRRALTGPHHRWSVTLSQYAGAGLAVAAFALVARLGPVALRRGGRARGERA